MRTALVLRDDSELHYDGTRQPKLTYDETFRIGVAFCDGAYIAERAIRHRLDIGWRESLQFMAPDYATIRDYLIDEANADERVAAQIALHLTAPLWRIFT